MDYTLASLQDEYRRGGRFRFLFFWGIGKNTNDRAVRVKIPASGDGLLGASCLSQWWCQSFALDGNIYSCAEQYMMAEKARLFGDEEMLAKIMAAKYPKEMKAYGRAVQHFDQERWDSCCYDTVKKASKAKFSQNPDLYDFLSKTKRRILVEASPLDRIWGIGMGESNPDAENPLKWRGKNLLGFALTQARDELMEEMK